MKTEIEKAHQLIEKFIPHAYPFSAGSGYLTGDIDEGAKRKHVKELATICVDEILSLYDKDYQDQRDKTYWHPYDYWILVKEELQTL